MLTLPVLVTRNPFPEAPCRLSRWRRYARQRRAVATWRWTCICVPEQIGTFCFTQVRETSGVGTLDCDLIMRLPLESKPSYWAVIRCLALRGHVTWPRWGTAPSSPPAWATHPAASCREPGGSEGPPLWSCRWPGRRWCRSGGTISALRSTEIHINISVSSKPQHFNFNI